MSKEYIESNKDVCGEYYTTQAPYLRVGIAVPDLKDPSKVNAAFIRLGNFTEDENDDTMCHLNIVDFKSHAESCDRGGVMIHNPGCNEYSFVGFNDFKKMLDLGYGDRYESYKCVVDKFNRILDKYPDYEAEFGVKDTEIQSGIDGLGE